MPKGAGVKLRADDVAMAPRSLERFDRANLFSERTSRLVWRAQNLSLEIMPDFPYLSTRFGPKECSIE